MDYLALLSDEQVRKYLKEVGDTVEILSREVDRLRQENDYLKSEKYKDSELSKMNSDIKNMREFLKHAYDVPDYKKESLEKWQLNHLKEKHGYGKAGDEKYLLLPVEMNYSYEFMPTTIGVLGACICAHCGDTFDISAV